MRRKISYGLKWATVVTALGGVLLGFFTARADGYSHWSKRALYFTTQSNIWIGLVMLFLALQPWLPSGERTKKRLYLCKYIFTASIVMTGAVFCFLLAPFAEDFPAWTPFSFSVHVFTPVLAVVDFFVDETPIAIERKNVWLTVLPPLCYCALASTLSFFEVDFGRGVPYPYFFLYFRSPSGAFGFSSRAPFFVGSFYWMVLFACSLFALGKLFKRLK